MALILDSALILSGQLKVHVPTGDAGDGLGRDFLAFEPGLLLEKPCHDWVVLNAQVDYFLPLDGHDFAGEYFPVFEVSNLTLLLQAACAAVVAVAAAILPAVRAAQTRIVQGLRAIG